MRSTLETRQYMIDSSAGNLEKLMEYIVAKRQFLLRLLENSNLLEHDSFTEMLWGVFHLADELSHRKTVHNLPKSDYQHLAGDIKRAYRLLVREWLDHMQHLLKNYPYLFSLAMRTNPFDPDAKVEVQAN